MGIIIKFISNSEQETMNLASKIAGQVKRNDIIVLSGDLGSGKTKFTEGFLKNFNLNNQISSPTFTIVNEYNYNAFNIYHFDVYRLENIDEFTAIGGEDYFNKGVCIIEWGELIEDILPPNYTKIIFTRDYNDDNIRYINFEFHGNSYYEIN